MIKIHGPENDNIRKYIEKSGTFYEIDLLEDSAQYLFDGAVVIDAGANIGNHSVFWGSLCNCEVHAFEPNLEAVGYLVENLQLYNKNFKVYAHALSDVEGIGAVVPHEYLGQCKIKYVPLGPVMIHTIDSYKLKPRLIKIDVEGFEFRVLKGALKTIKKYHPIIYVETHDDVEPIDKLLRLMNYKRMGVYGFTPTYKYI